MEYGTSIAVLHTRSFINGYNDFDRIKILSESGFHNIDYHLGEEYADRFDRDIPLLGDDWENWSKGIRYYATEQGCSIHQTHAPVPTVFEDENTEKHSGYVIDRAIRASALMGAGVIVCHPVNDPANRADSEQSIEKNAAFMRRRAELAQSVGIRIAVENMLSNRNFDGSENKRVCDNYAALDNLVMCIDMDNVGFCLDVGHACYMGWDIPDVVHRMGSRLFALHIHDNDTYNDEHLAPMTGVIDWPEFLKALKNSNYDGVLTLETLNFCRNHPRELHRAGLMYLADIVRWMANF